MLLFSPESVHNDSDLDSLSVFPFLEPSDVKKLKDELPTYLAKCADTDDSICPLDWWKRNCQGLPSWSAAAETVLLIQPSSASSERVFSLLSNNRQESALEDYVETSLMLQYNHR